VNTGGNQIVSDKTDVYMFGCLMYEVLTQQTPWYWLHVAQLLVLRSGPDSKSHNCVNDARAAGLLRYVVEGDHVASSSCTVWVASGSVQVDAVVFEGRC
jgi:hypothetical protein